VTAVIEAASLDGYVTRPQAARTVVGWPEPSADELLEALTR
jgi:hypothetical protein